MSNSGPAIRLYGEGREVARAEERYPENGELMSQYLVAVQLPDNFNPSAADAAAMGRDIDVLNEEMVAAGVRVFVGGLTPAREAKSLRAQPDGKVVTTDGPYLETKEHIGGFWVLEVASPDEALEWGRKAVIACRVPVEVRAFGIPT
jgi:hypothetical protein